MASTYVNNLRLEEMANGENSGTWGTKTNVNLELIGQSTAWGTRAIADASTDNITIADGSADADRCLGLKLTGGGQACTVTLLPNTSSKTWFMYNATSYTLTFTCGSGANVAIPAGQTKVIATDGLGSGGVVHDLLTGVSAAGDLNVAGDIITASTLQATGDTAAGDDAAIGYTAAEGLILTGQGSTNDVTIKNDADADVLEIPTGTTNVTVVGNFTASGNIATNGSQSQWSKGADVASNSALGVGTDGNYFDVTGTTTITSINTTGGAGTVIKLHFDGACQLTHSATNLILAGAQNFTTEAGDELEFVEYGSGTYRQTGWCLAGTIPGGGGGGAYLGEGASGASVGNSGDIIRVNEAILNTSQTMVATDNGSCTGPFSIASGVTLTLADGATFVVI